MTAGDKSARPLPRVRQAVILVGGKGTRLGELTLARPKPMMEITEDSCFLDFMIDNIARQGFDRITLLAGYLGDQVVAAYHGKTCRGAKLEVHVEQAPRGTAGALRDARGLLDERFLLLNGDTYFDIAYRALEGACCAAGDIDAVMALRRVPDCSRYGRVDLAEGRVASFVEKSAAGQAEGLINAGVYLLSRKVVDGMPAAASSLETEVFPLLAASGNLAGVESHGYFIDIGLPDTLAEAREELPRRRARPAIFLDRDGVLNLDHGYVHNWAQFDWVAGAREAVAAFNAAGWFVFVVTNQAGVAHGYYEEAAVQGLHDAIQDDLARWGGHVDAFYYCPYHPAGAREEYRRPHEDRKPNPGMIKRALAEWPVIDVESFLVGDRDTDLAAARAAGIPGLLFAGGNLQHFLAEHDRLRLITYEISKDQ